MRNRATSQRPWDPRGRIIPAGCAFPDKKAIPAESINQSSLSSRERLIPLGSAAPAVSTDEAARRAMAERSSRLLSGSLVPAGSTCPTVTDASRNHAIELEYSLGLAGRLVPMGSGPLVVANHRAEADGSPGPALSEAFLSDHQMPGHSRQTTILYSAVVHTILLAIVLIVPLWYTTDAFDPQKFMLTVLAAPPEFSTGSSPAPAASARAASAPAQPTTRRVFFQQGRLLFPRAIPKHAAIISEAAPAPEIAGGGAFGGVYGGLPGGVGGELFGGTAEPPPPPPAPAVDQPKKPLQVGGNVQPPKLIRQVAPEYPRLAKQALIQGDVVLSAIIDESGEVTELKAVSGPPLLFGAALDAVRQWRFQPTYLNGQPWPVAHEITVHFRL